MKNRYLLLMLILLVFFASGCFHGERERLFLFKDIPVELAVTSYSVDKSATSYVVMGRSNIVIQLATSDQHYICSWSLPAHPQRLFCTNQGFIAVTEEEIFGLSPTGLIRKGSVPSVADLKDTPVEQLKISRQKLIPILSSDCELLWQVASSGNPEKEPLLLVWTDLNGAFIKWKSFDGLKRAASSIRFSSSGRSAAFKTLAGSGSLLVTADIQVETELCEAIVSKGYNEDVFLYSDHFVRLIFGEANLVKCEYAGDQLLKHISEEKRSCFILSSGLVITADGVVQEYTGSTLRPHSSLKYCTHDEKFVYMIDPGGSRFVKVDISTENIVAMKAKGIPIFFDSAMKAEIREDSLYVNDKFVLRTDLEPHAISRIFRVGRLLVFSNSWVVNTETGSIFKVENGVWSFQLRDYAVFISYGIEGGDVQLFVRVFDSGSNERSGMSIINGIKPDYPLPLGDSAYLVETYRDDSAAQLVKLVVKPEDLSVSLEQMQKGSYIELFPGVGLNVWSPVGGLFDDEGNVILLPPMTERNERSLAMSLPLVSRAPFIEADSSVYYRCGCNFMRILSRHEPRIAK